MMRCRVQVTITKVFEAEFEDTPAAARMFKTLERDRLIGTLNAATGDGWKVRQETQHHSVVPLHEPGK